MAPHPRQAKFEGIRRDELLHRGIFITDPLAQEFIETGTIEGLPPPRNCYDGATLKRIVEIILMPEAERPQPHERITPQLAPVLAKRERRQQARAKERTQAQERAAAKAQARAEAWARAEAQEQRLAQHAKHLLERHTLYPAMEARARSEAAGGADAPLPHSQRQQLEDEAHVMLWQAMARQAAMPSTPPPPLCECGRPDLRALMAADAAREAEAAVMTPDEREAMNDVWAPLLRVLASEVGQRHILPRLGMGAMQLQTHQARETLRALRLVCRKACAAVNNYVTRLMLPAPPELWSAVAKFSAPASAGGRPLQRLAVKNWPHDAAFSQDDAVALAGLAAPGLQELHICVKHHPWQDSALGPGAMRTLVQQAHWPALQELSFTAGALSSQDVVALSQSQWPQLRILEFCGTGTALGVRGAAALARAPWPQLQTLMVQKPGMTAVGAAALAGAHWPGLQLLSLHRGRLGDAGARALAGADWPALTQCVVQGNGVGEEGHAALQARWPAAEIVTL